MSRLPWKRRLAWTAGALAALAAPVVGLALGSPIDPLPYRPAEPLALSGALAPNQLLRATRLLAAGRLPGPEDVAIDSRGRLYCGTADGALERLAASGEAATVETLARLGRPLGLDFAAGDLLWIADSERGLLSLSAGGELTEHLGGGGRPLGFADDVDVSASGRIFVSDASHRHGPGELLLDTLEARPHGRLIEYRPADGGYRVLLEGLYFANGVAVAPDESFVLVAETFRYRIRRLWLAGPRAGRDEILIDRLPGFPDGVSAAADGTFWVALYGPRAPALDRWLHPRPLLKRLVAWLPAGWLPGPPAYGMVLSISADGRVLRSLHDPGGAVVPSVTSVEADGDTLYLGSLALDGIGRWSPA